MRQTSATAALLATAVIGGLGLTPTAAHAQAGAPAARAAWIKSCIDKKSDVTYPCGHWQLIMRDGSRVTVRGAANTMIDGDGDEIDDTSTFAISADGRVLAYERAGDHRLVVQRVGGPAKVLPTSFQPRRTENLSLYLSPKGDRVLIDYTDDPARLPAKVVTVATGKITTLPAADTMLGFSGDGDEVLATRYLSDNTMRLSAYRLDGGSIKRTPPQVVANTLTTALSPDGRTVAVFTAGNTDKKTPPRVRLYDLANGELSAGADLPLKAGDAPYLASWDAGGRLTAVVQNAEEGHPAVVRVLTVDPETGGTTQTDKYTISKSRYAFIVAGE
ncbi:hypothetical protein ACFLIM_31510 [Nonomuraea sp. M3C6]|uniref:WD40-like Beta Propeller Repeat n=1 Tax=Nonomuraea marmarensis TaxID=3351344 RepID=A0ABW7AK80_9ACTN